MERYANKQNLVQLAKAVHDRYSPVATPTANGLMSAEDKAKVDALGKTDDPTDAGPIVELTAKGWAEQDTTTGKNLLPNTVTSQTINGVTFTVNADGSVTVNGTASANSELYITQTMAALSSNAFLSGCPTGGSVGTYSLRAVGIGGDSGNGLAIPSGANLSIYIRIASGYTANNLTFYPQLELGSTATSYEPYTGGAPSPSPSYPQEIRRVTGRNLLHNTATSQTINGVTFTVNEDGSVTANGTATSDANFVIHGLTTPLAASSGTYTISGLPNGGSNTTYRMVFYCKNNQNTTIVDRLINTQSFTFTVSEDIAAAYCGIRIISGYTCNNLVFKLQLEAGSVAHPYVPYGCVGVDVHGHNLASDGVKQGVYAFGNGVYTAGNKYYVCTELMPCEVGTSYVASLTSAFTPAACYVAWFRSDGTFISNTTTTKTGDGFATVAAPDGAALFGVSFLGPSDTQVSPSDVTGVYVGEGHITTIPIPLPSRGWVAALPDGTADTLTLDGAGGYVWELACEEVTETDATGWGVNGTSTIDDESCTKFIKNYASKRVGSAWVINGDMMCDTLVPITDGTLKKYGYLQRPSNGGVEIYMPDSVASDTTELAAFFAAHPTTFLYPLATPMTESGYVDSMPTVPIHASISSTDLHDLTVRCCADSGAAEIAAAWGRKYESRIANLESAVATLVTAGA